MTNIDLLMKKSSEMKNNLDSLTIKAQELNDLIQFVTDQTVNYSSNGNGFIYALTIFILSCIVGYHIVWRVTPALHTPLMSVTNAISGIVIIGAMIAAGNKDFQASNLLGLFGVVLAAINIFGGFFVTYRMLSMFRKK